MEAPTRVQVLEQRIRELRSDLQRLGRPGRRPRTGEGKEMASQLAEAVEAALRRDDYRGGVIND